MNLKPSDHARFWKRVDLSGVCWLWTGYLNEDGYGTFGIGGRAEAKTLMAHRFAYQLMVGPIPEGLVIDHLCRNRACVNPTHMEPVTDAENIRRGDSWKINGLKTHCHKGHPLAGDNLYLYRGSRKCRACAADRNRAYKARKRQGTA